MQKQPSNLEAGDVAPGEVKPQPLYNPAFELSLARTAYNYTRTYPNLEAVPLCARVPDAEDFTTDYNVLVLRSNSQIADNFVRNVRRLLEKELKDDLEHHALNLVADIVALVNGLAEVTAEALRDGSTALLKSALWDMLRRPLVTDRDFLQAENEEDYADLIDTLPKPLMLAIHEAAWMPPRQTDPKMPPQLACQDDWFFGYLQVAGFNTTNLRGVVATAEPGKKTVVWSDLQRRMPLSDAIFQSVLGDKTKTLAQAVAGGNLYVCDYTFLLGDGNRADKESTLHGKHRYLPSPIALFYWNEKPPSAYPPGYRGDGSKTDGVLQPIAIQLSAEPGSTIFTPNDCSGANDPRGWKWKIAKYFVNVACAIQHESVAHLGDCHFIIESVAVATHRQLTEQHPVFKLLAPHLRFTLIINDGALRNLVVPGGVVATNIGPNIHWTLTLVNEARKAWRWDENHPERIFAIRGVDVDRPLVFPFRDDTLLLWKATKSFVRSYVQHYYPDDGAVTVDRQLAGWLQELTSPEGADFKGLEKPATREELTEILAQIIYTAGPLHASLNYAQYPLGGYMPSVAATIYQPAPTSETLVDKTNYLSWFPPLDVALYTLSFEYLLSSVQYDVFGHYSPNPQFAWFAERELEEALGDFQRELRSAEVAIQDRNRKRPMPYPFQLPSRVPNSISI
jgi:arachidonate 15-lipoxygenase